MNKRLWAALLAVVLVLAALFFPQRKASPVAVDHQHETWPQETAAADGLHPDGSLTTHLPLIILHTDGRTVPGAVRSDTAVLPITYSVIDNGNGVNSSADTPSQEGTAQLAIRGNSSRRLPKKQYSLKLVDEQGLPRDEGLLGLPPESIWVLNGSFIDHSMLRNYMIYNLSGEIMDYAPRTRLCEVMLTDKQGKCTYQGVYTLIEKPKVSDSRLPLAPYDPSHAETSALLQMNAYIDPSGEFYIDNNPLIHLLPDNINAHKVGIEYPDPLEITPETKDYLQKQVTMMDRVLYDAIHTHDWSRVEQFLDLDSFVDYYLINEFFQNYDAGNISTYFYQNNGGSIHMGPVWDFDGSMNNFHTEVSPFELRVHYSFYYYYLSQSKIFIDRCIQRYAQLRRGVLSEENLTAYIQESAAYLGHAADRNCQLWYDDGPQEFHEDVRAMLTFVRERGRWMDENFARLVRVSK